MNELVTTQQQEAGLAISEDTKALIVSGISDNTLKVYRRATQELEAWLDGQILKAVLLEVYISPS